MEAVSTAISGLRNDLYNFANLALTQVADLAQAAMGGTNAAIQSYNNLYHTMQTYMQDIQNGVYQAQHQALANQLQPLYDSVNALVMSCQNVANAGYLDDSTKNEIVQQYQQVDQLLQQLLGLAQQVRRERQFKFGTRLSPLFFCEFTRPGALMRAFCTFNLFLSHLNAFPHFPFSSPLSSFVFQTVASFSVCVYGVCELILFFQAPESTQSPASPSPSPRPTSVYGGQQGYDQSGGYQQEQTGYAPTSGPRPPQRPPSVYGPPPGMGGPGGPGMGGAPTGPPTGAAPAAGGADPRASKALTDFIGSENEYVKHLTIIINARHFSSWSCTVPCSLTAPQNYFKPMRTWSAANKRVVQETEIDAIFRPIEIIQQLHAQMLQRLQVAAANPSGEKAGSIVKNLVTGLKVYTSYIQSLDSSIQVLQRCKKTGKPFQSFLDDCKSKSGNNQDIEALVVIPQKRMGQYDVLIQVLRISYCCVGVPH